MLNWLLIMVSPPKIGTQILMDSLVYYENLRKISLTPLMELLQHRVKLG